MSEAPAEGTWAEVALGRPRLTPRATGYAAIGIAALVGALGTSRPELAVVAAPFLALALMGLGATRARIVQGRATLSSERVMEGDEVTLHVELRAPAPVGHLEVLPALPEGISPAGGPEPTDGPQPTGRPEPTGSPRPPGRRTPAGFRLSMPAGARREQLSLSCSRWGAYDLGTLHLRAWDRLGLSCAEGTLRARAPLRVLPPLATLRALVEPAETRAMAGNQLSRRPGEGTEFADILPFRPGDRARSVNWRATARHGELWVNQQHMELATDVILFVDIFEEAWDDAGAGTLARSVEAAARLASAYLARRDRVGLISLGGYLEWVTPAMGTTALYRIVDALLASAVVPTSALKDLRSLPVRGLPPRALVLALTPLLDARAVGILHELRRRGRDVAVVDVSPLSYEVAGKGRRRRADDHRARVRSLARRLWALERDRLHDSLRSAGIAVVAWKRDEPVEVAVQALEATRRARRRGA